MQTWAQVLTLVREDVSFSDVKVKIPEKGWPVDVNDVMHRKRARRIFGILKKSFSWVPGPEEDGWLSLARSGLVAGTTHVGGADGKVIIERLCISLPYVEIFNSKVIKGFVLELRSRYVFFVFRDSYVLCIYVMNILWTFHISVSGYGTNWSTCRKTQNSKLLNTDLVSDPACAMELLNTNISVLWDVSTF